MPADDLDEHQLAQFGKNAFAAGPLVRGLRYGEANKLAEPAVSGPPVAGLDHPRQIFKKRIERPRVTREEGANQIGGRAFVTIVDEERKLAVGHRLHRLMGERVGAHARAARHHVRIALGEDDDFAGRNLGRLPADDAGETAALVTT